MLPSLPPFAGAGYSPVLKESTRLNWGRASKRCGQSEEAGEARMSAPTAKPGTDQGSPVTVPSLLELEITGFCQLACVHCYAGSGPQGGRGSMTPGDWEHVIGQAAVLGIGTVQFIGGEPALDPDLPRLVRHALRAGVRVYVFSNLVRVTPEL